MNPSPTSLYEFGPFQLDPSLPLLTRSGQPVPLPPKALETLVALVERGGRVVTREELIKAVWADSIVEENNLSVNVSILRKTLGGGASYIETVPRRGYRFTAAVRQLSVESHELVYTRRTRSETVIEESSETDAEPNALAQTSFTDLTPQTNNAPFAAVAANRFLPASQLRTLTRWPVVVTLVILVAALGASASFIRRASLREGDSASERKGNAASGWAEIRTLAVLPFATVDGGRENEHQGLGLADVLITRLSNIKELSVRPTSAVLNLDERESISAGKRLKVDAVLEGTIYRATDKVRVTARLIRVSDGAPMWAGQFEKPLQDELRLQDEIALQVTDALALNLSGGERSALTKRYTDSADAYHLYLKGRYHWNKRNYDGLAEAARLFRNAIERDPGFALAYVGLADATMMGADMARARIAINRALELDPNLAEAHATYGFIQAFHHWRWPEAEASLKHAIDLNPGYATAHQWYGNLLNIQGRTDEAKASLRRALEINPLSHNFLADLGQAHYFAGEYDQAEEYCLKALEIHPDFFFAHDYLYRIYLQKGEYQKALEHFIKATQIQLTVSDLPVEDKERAEEFFAKLRKAYHERGGRGLMEVQLGMHKLPGATYDYGRAQAHAFLGEKEKALDDLEAAYRSRTFMLAFMKTDPLLESLRGEPRFQELQRKMNLS